MVMELKFGVLMENKVENMKVDGLMEKNMHVEYLLGQMVSR